MKGEFINEGRRVYLAGHDKLPFRIDWSSLVDKLHFRTDRELINEGRRVYSAGLDLTIAIVQILEL